MPTKGEAIHNFLASFGVPAYASASVPDDAALPYLTYDLADGAWDSGEVSVVCDLWYRTESEAIPNAKVAEISEGIGLGGKIIPFSGGAVWVKRGSPFAQAVQDEAGIRRRLINISLEYISID